MIVDGNFKAAAHTGHDHGPISTWLKDPPGQAHHCVTTGKHWEYRLIAHAVVCLVAGCELVTLLHHEQPPDDR